MKNQHTPGPWRVVCASAHEFNPDTLRKDIIGKCEFGDAYVAGDIAANDATLISAAPELLDACKAIIEQWEEETRQTPFALRGHPHGLTIHAESVRLREQARSAIAKAEGAK